jgi:hypothetical protein
MNTDVYTGADGAIVLSAPEGLEGEAAKTVLTEADLTVVGRVQNVRIEVRSEVYPYNEIGQRYPTQLRAGNVSIRGTFGRAYVNGAILSLLLGEARSGRPAASWVQPAFNVTVRIANPSNGAVNTLTLHDVKIDNWVYTLPEDEFVMEQAGFQALYMTVEEG